MSASGIEAGTPAARVAAVEGWFAGINARDLDRALGDFAEYSTWLGMEDGKRRVFEGKPAIHAYLKGFSIDFCIELTLTIRHIAADGNVVLVEWDDVAKTVDGEYRNDGSLVFEFDSNDRINHVRSYFQAAA